jgi:hypothetical protein
MPGRAAAIEQAVLAALPILFILGFAGIVVTVATGFEEPNAALLLFSALALLAPLVATLVHLLSNKELTPAGKRAWLRQLVGKHAAQAWSSYLTTASGTRSGPSPPPPRNL